MPRYSKAGRPSKLTTEHDCKYCEGVLCKDPPSKCAKCGWNPAVTTARKDRFREEHNYGPRDDAQTPGAS